MIDNESIVNLDFDRCVSDYFAVCERTYEKERLFELYRKLLENQKAE